MVERQSRHTGIPRVGIRPGSGRSCRGGVYRLLGNKVPTYFPALWEREMSTGAYVPRWLNCVTESDGVCALVFTMNRENPAYIRALPDEELIAVIRRASGRYGPCTDYVLLRAAGIRDQRLNAISYASKPIAVCFPKTEGAGAL